MTPSAREEIEKVAVEVIDYASLFSDGEAQHQNLKKGIINAILTHVAKVRAEEREKLAKFMLARNFATGHGDTIEDLLKELDWNINKLEKE